MTVALEGGEWSAARPGRTLPPGKTRYRFYRRLGGPKGRSGRVENIVSTGIFFFFKCFGLFTWFVLQFVIVNYIIVFTFVW